ncbi:fumarylacetoacetate hydrolase family protein [Umezawaea tangerina]|uniref:2-keto-4-pentenoate hydratase/2-oxohepta-3-ene-1,7-dioic acid hydratase in catechol pathway n=1 Tax=Umezawaea tangerina TaxID=84725 RepID=A0A2T0TGB4_9PSEU|nr:fumarylacetoacetate hydrolase family protein [Umezawaea tangerina]PRY44671.1 2-keto-4-pentenoate hydratase/2-oxohepta-3-ene-1,7-dioic acid hydratase in catechol pathway [Umezawaea tangerina]
MRIGNLDSRLVLVTDRGAVDVATASGGEFGPDPQEVYVRWEAFVDWAAALDLDSAAAVPFDPERLGAPVPRPGQLFAIGMNYRDHAAEAGFDLPESPPVFTKFRGSITGPSGRVVLPGETVDWEVELVVVIGRTASRVSAEDAWSHVAGITAGQDLSERTTQLAGPAPQFSLGKSFPGFTPMGPWLVTLDELVVAGLDRDALDLGCSVNGESVQKGNTADLVFSVPELIARLSAVLPLEPGDVIFTGTPAGVGAARDPRWFLKPGDRLVSTIAGIGELDQQFVAASKEM